jgi:hypothetical protein
VRNDPALYFTRCRAVPHEGREILVCVAEFDHQKGMAGKSEYWLGVYDPVSLRHVDPDNPADSAAWHALPVATSDAWYHCQAGESAARDPVRFVRIVGLAVDAAQRRITLSGESASGAFTPAFQEACSAEADLGRVLASKAFSVDFTLSGRKIAPSARAKRWLSKQRQP